MSDPISDDKVDDAVDATIRQCLDMKAPQSFFLYAGAGSGKTRSLVEAVRHVCRTQGRQLTLTGQKLAVITYTNAACDEIRHRLGSDARVEVATIHAFSWSLISGFNEDIRAWVSENLLQSILELENEQRRGRSGKASDDRARSIRSKTKRRENLSSVHSFTYSPTGLNQGRDSLNHAEVIAMTADFLASKKGLQRILTSRHPILLVDESQDTNKNMMDAFLSVQAKHETTFCLGLFGDTMQRIYADGKVGLAEALGPTWAKPAKRMNHRCPVRIVELINTIRADEDTQRQQSRADADTGHARLFVVAENAPNRDAIERDIAKRMIEITGDQDWDPAISAIKTLTLEHRMAARRFGFDDFFAPLYQVERLRTSLLGGSLAGASFFTESILPLVEALKSGDRFAAAALVRAQSPLLEPARLQQEEGHQLELLKKAKNACDELLELWKQPKPPSLRAILSNVARTELFSIPDSLAPFSIDDTESDTGSLEEDENEELVAWRNALKADYEQMMGYHAYVSGAAPFDTHQGVKGREFPRVMVVVSDAEAKGFMFSYDKLWGVKVKTKADLANESAGKETSEDRSRRLFYVTCSRAMKSLAVVYYADRPEDVRRIAIEKRWFTADEVEVIS